MVALSLLVELGHDTRTMAAASSAKSHSLLITVFLGGGI